MTKVITPPATLSYPWLAEAQQPRNAGQKAKYSAMLIFAPGTDLTAVKQAAVQVAIDKFGEKVATDMIRAGKLKMPFRNGAEKDLPEGSIFINVRGNNQPGLAYPHAGPDGRPALVKQEDITKVFYPGAKVRAALSGFYYDTEGNKGVSFGLNNVQKLGEGERLDNQKSAADEFEAVLDAAPADLAGLI